MKKFICDRHYNLMGISFMGEEVKTVGTDSHCLHCASMTRSFHVGGGKSPFNKIKFCLECLEIKDKPQKLEASADHSAKLIVEIEDGTEVLLSEKYSKSPVRRAWWVDSADIKGQELTCYNKGNQGSIVDSFWEDQRTLYERQIYWER